MPSTLLLTFIAPIPVGHTIRIGYYACKRFFSSKLKTDSEHPVIMDQSAGIRYAYVAMGNVPLPFR